MSTSSTLFDYKAHTILYIDDEVKSLKYFEQTFSDKFRILTADNAADGFKLFQEHIPKVAILITDQQMPGEKGTQLLERARAHYPHTLRILATAYADLQSAIDAVNTGAIYKFITKPWDIPQLEIMLLRGIEFYALQQERERLLREKLEILQELITRERILSLGILSAGLSHHLNNAMTAIKTFLDLAPIKLQAEAINPQKLKNPEFWHDFHHQAQLQTQRIATLLQQLSIADPLQSSLYQSKVHLHSLIDDALEEIRPLQEEKQITIEYTSTPDLPSILTDENKIRQALELILKDEITTLPKKSVIKIGIPSWTSESITLEIEDNGQPLSQEAPQFLFNPFFQRDDLPQEYGIHLMAAYILLHQVGAKIQATKASKNKGTRFTLTLPTTPPAPSHLPSNQIDSFIQNQEILEKILSGKT